MWMVEGRLYNPNFKYLQEQAIYLNMVWFKTTGVAGLTQNLKVHVLPEHIQLFLKHASGQIKHTGELVLCLYQQFVPLVNFDQHLH